jgi:glycosyltransferase involved in cell wall biosynthesis
MKAKILFALESFFPTHRAGTEVYVLNLCKYLISKGWEVNVIIATTEGTKDYSYEGIKVQTFDIPKQANAAELNGLIPPRGIAHFIARIKEINPAIIHFHSFGRAINSYHLKAAKELGIITAFTPHLGGNFCIKGDMRLMDKENCDGKVMEKRCLKCFLRSKGHHKLSASLLSYAIPQFLNYAFLKKKLPATFNIARHRKQELERIQQYADIVFSIAPWIQEAFVANGIHKAQLIPQGISPIFFDNEGKILTTHHSPLVAEPSRSIHFAFIGRMHPSKGFHLLQEAWESIKNDQVQLSIITNPSGGETEYFKKHKAWAQQQDNIVWNEALSQQEVAQYLNKVDVLILPSISNEVSPLVILEAATRKIPVIGSDYIAIKGMIQHNKNGLLFKNGDVEHLKMQIQKCIHNNKLITTLSSNIKKPHSMNEVAEIIEQSYKLSI